MQQKKGRRKEEYKDNPDGQPEKEPEGVTKGALHALGNIVPDFSELVERLEKSEAFQERLKLANAEIKHRLEKVSPLKRADGARSCIIPSRTTVRISRTRPRGQPQVRVPKRDVITDIFDEGDHFLVIAELPGASDKDINIEVKGARLVIHAKAESCQCHKEIGLPCLVEDKIDSSYRNGILRIVIRKERK